MRLSAMPLPYSSIHDEMDRMLKAAFPASPRTRGLDFDLSETESGYELVIDLPGCRDEDIEISIEGPVLSLRARRPGIEEAENTGRKSLRKRREIAIDESIRFPVELDGDGVTATLDRGELRLVLPKLQSKLPRKIEIKRG